MLLTLPKSEFKEYISSQLQHFFPDNRGGLQGDDINSAFEMALLRAEDCFSHILIKGYSENGNATFNHLHSDQYSQFLYFFSNSLWETSQNRIICDKLIYLNRVLNGIFVSYKCKLPRYFVFAHPVGTVIGNASYSDFLVIFQNVTINTGDLNNGEILPKLGKALFLGAGSKIIGNERIGDRVSLGVNTLVHNLYIPDDSTVINLNGQTIVQKRKKNQCFAQNYFDIQIN